jgi:hypothetical protein
LASGHGAAQKACLAGRLGPLDADYKGAHLLHLVAAASAARDAVHSGGPAADRATVRDSPLGADPDFRLAVVAPVVRAGPELLPPVERQAAEFWDLLDEWVGLAALSVE